MFLLYLDDSGSLGDKGNKFFVLGGICIFERQTHWLESHLNSIASRFNSVNPSAVELHAAPMRNGDEIWRRFSPQDRIQATADALNLLSSTEMRIKVFAVVIEKSQIPADSNGLSIAFEKIAVEFDGYLKSCYINKNPQRGLVIFDKSKDEAYIQNLSSTFKHVGHSNGNLRNFAEVPLFIDSKASRLMQMADMVAYWIYRRYSAGDDSGFKFIQPFFHRYGGINHGLKEIISDETRAELVLKETTKYVFTPSGIGVAVPDAVPQSH
ncbi:MAG: hypothetical protein DDT25_00864 [Chloroflexi bacterium]|nr:hypothetical protein [Chloroflexota bacterium]